MKLIKFVCIFLLLLGSDTALAGEAVSEVNGKLDFSYGDMDSNRGKNVSGSISIPLSTNFGLQTDGLYTRVSGRDFYGAGAQFFWRDSLKGLMGISCAGIYEEDMYSLMGGFMGEYYLDSFTLSLSGGVAQIKYDVDSVPFIETDETKPYASASIGFYPIDNLLLAASYTHAFENKLFQCQIEYQTPISGFSVFADIAKGDEDYDQALFGVRYYFGKQKALKQRHREDDPQNIVSSVLTNIGTYGAEYNSKAKEYNNKAREYNERILNDPSIGPILYPDYAMPYYPDDSFGFYMESAGLYLYGN